MLGMNLERKVFSSEKDGCPAVETYFGDIAIYVRSDERLMAQAVLRAIRDMDGHDFDRFLDELGRQGNSLRA